MLESDEVTVAVLAEAPEADFAQWPATIDTTLSTLDGIPQAERVCQSRLAGTRERLEVSA